jgi:dipeptidyl aminopeptidase/acylaminoacyl peptidase
MRRTLPKLTLLSLTLLALLLAVTFPVPADQLVYQKPPKDVLDILNLPAPPNLSVNPTRTYALMSDAERYPSIAEVSAPMLRLAGMRIDPRTNGLHLAPHSRGMTLVRLSDGVKIAVALPPNARAGVGNGGRGGRGGGREGAAWSPDGKQFVFENTMANGIELWVCDATSGKTHRIEGVKLNAVLGDPVDWLTDGKTLLVKSIPAGRAAAPAELVVPKGPDVQESAGHAGPVPTYEDMLKSPHDEDLFEYYATSQLLRVDVATGKTTPLGKPGVLENVTPSPDGKDILVTRIHRPFSYQHPAREFPTEVEVWDQAGSVTYKVASLPLAERVPLGGVRTGPRMYRWIPTEAATLMWVEAMDGGNPKEKVPNRDRIVAIKAPFKGEPAELFKTEQRFGGIQFGPTWAMVEDTNRDTRVVRTFELDLSKPNPQAKLIWSRNQQDRYNDPGQPVQKALGNGQRLIAENKGSILLSGLGASAQGDRPFLRRFNLETKQTDELFRSSASSYEAIVAVLDDTGAKFITRRESSTEPPNYYLHNGKAEQALTAFKDPAPQLRRIKKELVTYKRADGVPLSFTLYLPPDYKPGTRLPTVVWAYPTEFTDSDTAGQISGSLQRFTTITGPSHLFFLLQGYAILDNAAMPVVGSPETVNNTYLEQITADAKAAIDKAAEMGVTDPNRVGVGGHSYGGFMTANLLAHSRLFRAGIARSGAYNRSLTPFGFQNERRTFWEAQDVYLKMSPFLSADKIKDPILLIHGEADDNTGTFPVQSERMYAAIRGNGGTVRLVMLPDEAHGYRAKETIEHVVWEMLTWFDKYVKQAGPVNSRAD